MLAYCYLCGVMEITSAQLKVSRSARYFVLGDSRLPVESLIIALHGYGMQAKTFIAQFESMVKPGVLIVAPEGLSRFYRKGFSGEVVASWMTSEERLSEIEDYINFLDQLHSLLAINPATKTIVLGFSQGAVTASRWLMKGQAPISELILWCGEFAGEVMDIPSKQPIVRHVIATQDEFIPLSRFKEQSARLKHLFKSYHEYTFDGSHVIDQEVLKTVFMDAGV